jgi:hypothetical protein
MILLPFFFRLQTMLPTIRISTTIRSAFYTLLMRRMIYLIKGVSRRHHHLCDVCFSSTVQSRQHAIIDTTQDLIVSRFATSSHSWRIESLILIQKLISVNSPHFYFTATNSCEFVHFDGMVSLLCNQRAGNTKEHHSHSVFRFPRKYGEHWRVKEHHY